MEGRECYKGIIQISAQLYFVAMITKIKMLSSLNVLQSSRLSLQAGHMLSGSIWVALLTQCDYWCALS